MARTTADAARRAVSPAFILMLMVLAGLGQASAQADVTAVSGGAYGYHLSVSLFGQPPAVRGPSPSVTLPAGGSATPITATAASGSAAVGPATFFSSGQIDVSTAGTTGPSGSVTSSSSIANVNTSGQEVLTATALSSTCSATGALSGSTAISGGTLQVDNGDSDPTNSIPDHAAVNVSLPANPAPGTGFDGHQHFGNSTDTFRYTFNEQLVDAGSIVVSAAHQQFFGPTTVGDLYLGRSTCGLTGAPADTIAPETTIDSGPSGVSPTASPSFTFSSSEPGSSFACRLDGPGTTAGTFSACSSPLTYASLDPGDYTFAVRATDPANNTDGTPATATFTIAGAQPTVSLQAPAPGPAVPTGGIRDVTAPTAAVSAARRQPLARTLRVRIRCVDEPCRAVVRGVITLRRASGRGTRSFRLKTVAATIPKGASATLRPRLSASLRTAARAALRRRRRAVVQIVVQVSDAAGNARTIPRKVTLTR